METWEKPQSLWGARLFATRFGKEQSPDDLETIADLQHIPAMLKEKGYSEKDIEGVMHANWVKFFTTAWAHL